ncbi:hypothetical protein [Actinomyces vulturis]|uniref:hypothetical protein n=1 Tax=Actinomyces vulturis TaxID=1857645 RepID=UPI000836BD58|nr:hypothetical protein [Actinomyces vulturis]
MAIFYALLAAVIYAVASTLQAWAAARAEGPAVVRHPAYLLGMLCDGGAWAISLVAMATMPLFAVQSILASSLALTAVFVSVLMRIRLRLRDIVCMVVLIPALGMIASSAKESSAHPPSYFVAVMAVAAAVVGIISLLFYAKGPSWLGATLGGVGFSGAALCARAVEGLLDFHDLWTQICGGMGGVFHVLGILASEPLIWTMGVFSLVGVLLYARAMEVGSPVGATAILWAVEVIIPTVAGVILLGDEIGAGNALAASVGILAVLVCSSVLATSPAQA